MRPDWDEYFLYIASAVSQRADCTRRKVGAVIVDEDHRIVSTGYNGAPAGEPGCLEGACPRGQFTREEMPGYQQGNQNFDNCIAIHAEANAVIYAGQQWARDGTIYITAEPCTGCRKLIAAAGITRICYPVDGPDYSYKIEVEDAPYSR